MVSEQLKQMLKKGTIFSPDAKVSITTGSEELIEFTSDDLLAGIEVEQSALSSSGSPIGGLATGELKVTLKSFDQAIGERVDFHDLKTISFLLEFDREIYVSDVYNIDKTEVSESRLELVITAYDPVFNLNQKYEEPVNVFPTTAGRWLAAFADKYGINIDASELMFIKEEIQRPNVDDMSAKQVLSKFLEWNFAAGAYRDGKIVCKTVGKMPLIPEEFDRDSVIEYSSKTNGLGRGGVNTLTLALSEDIQSENHSISDDGMIGIEGKPIEIRLSGNPFFSTSEQFVEYTPRIFSMIKGFNYEAFELETRALYIKPLDVIRQVELNTLNPTTYDIPVYTYRMNYDGEFKVVLGAPKMDNAETEYKWSQISPSKRAEIRVDKIDGRITAVSEEVGEFEGELRKQSAEIEIEKDKITSLAIDTNKLMDDYKGDLDQLSERFTKSEQDSEKFKLIVSHSNGQNLLKNSVMYNDTEFWDIENGLRGETNSWSLSKTSKHCITGNGYNEQTVNIVSGESYAISFDYLKQSAAGILTVYYKIRDEETIILEQREPGDGTTSIYLEDTAGGELVIGVRMDSISESQPSYIANLMLAKNEVYEWSPAVGEIYTINVLVDESGIKVKNIDGNAYTAMTPYEFAHYYDNEKVFSFDRQIAQVQDLLVKGKTFELDGGIKWINDKTSGRVILVNMRGGN